MSEETEFLVDVADILKDGKKKKKSDDEKLAEYFLRVQVGLRVRVKICKVDEDSSLISKVFAKLKDVKKLDISVDFLCKDKGAWIDQWYQGFVDTEFSSLTSFKFNFLEVGPRGASMVSRMLHSFRSLRELKVRGACSRSAADVYTVLAALPGSTIQALELFGTKFAHCRTPLVLALETRHMTSLDLEFETPVNFVDLQRVLKHVEKLTCNVKMDAIGMELVEYLNSSPHLKYLSLNDFEDEYADPTVCVEMVQMYVKAHPRLEFVEFLCEFVEEYHKDDLADHLKKLRSKRNMSLVWMTIGHTDPGSPLRALPLEIVRKVGDALPHW